jgi:hypothetical protein
MMGVMATYVPQASAQWTAMKRGSDNIDVVAHLPLGGRVSAAPER